jgi:hypothetical protein
MTPCREPGHAAIPPCAPQFRHQRRRFPSGMMENAENRANFAGLRQRSGEKDRLHRNYRDFRRI